MATGVLRRIAAQSIRVFSQRSSALHPKKICERRLHLSAATWQMYFTEKHEWVDVPEGSNEGTIGITEYAQDALGDIVFIQLPEIGVVVEENGEAGVLESVKAASDLYSPLSGVVTQVNNSVVENPNTVNSSPYKEGWLYKMTVTNPEQLNTLMDEAGYNEFLKAI